MDIQHIAALIDMLSSLGFPASTGRKLLFNACIRQSQFVICERMCFGKDTISYQLSLKEDPALKRLICTYYDATLRKAVEIPASVVNGIDVFGLEKRMSNIDWKLPVEHLSSNKLDLADENTWKQEAVMDDIVKDLEQLASTEEGVALANLLKYKFWMDSNLQRLIPESSNLKGKYELSQRFYIINSDGISATEAYRFLNNRWLERSIHASNRISHQTESVRKETRADVKSTGNKKQRRHLKVNSRK